MRRILRLHYTLTVPSSPWYIAVDPFGPQQGQRWHDYIDWINLPQIVELVTLDHVLCPPVVDPLTPEDWNHNVQADFLTLFFVDLDHVLRRVSKRSPVNVLAVMRQPAEADFAAFQGPGFEFMGFDLIEKPGLGISALTNCGGGWPLAVANSDLNAVGLLPTYALARSAQRGLVEHYAAEHHADCNMWAVWRLAHP